MLGLRPARLSRRFGILRAGTVQSYLHRSGHEGRSSLFPSRLTYGLHRCHSRLAIPCFASNLPASAGPPISLQRLDFLIRFGASQSTHGAESQPIESGDGPPLTKGLSKGRKMFPIHIGTLSCGHDRDDPMVLWVSETRRNL